MTSARVTLIACTWFAVDDAAEVMGGWLPGPDTDGGSALCEAAGRACYQSWKRPREKTATNAGYLAHILEVGHLSVLEHASATFYIEGISRSLSHELIRHRHFSYSQLSQRYVDESDTEFVEPPLVSGDFHAVNLFHSALADARSNYTGLVYTLTEQFPDKTRKEIREAARSVLPNATETKIVVTGNYRAWREFIVKRATEQADAEIRALAVEVLRRLQSIAPNVFNDFAISTVAGGAEVAASKWSGWDVAETR